MINYLLSVMTTIVFDGLVDLGIFDTLDVSKAWQAERDRVRNSI